MVSGVNRVFCALCIPFMEVIKHNLPVKKIQGLGKFPSSG